MSDSEHHPLCDNAWKHDGWDNESCGICVALKEAYRQGFKDSGKTHLHDCCEEYAENCVSCSLHESIRQDERQIIASLVDKSITWQDQSVRSRVISTVSRGSRNSTVEHISPYEISIDEDVSVAYLWIEKESIKPPLTTLTDVDCNIDIDADGKVLGVEILKWPKPLSGTDS